MMKKLFLLLAFFSVLVGCKQDEPTNQSTQTATPVAKFTFQNNGNTVSFTNQSSNATTFEWDFGDGNKSSEKNPSHTYAAEGSYQVTLTASNEVGSSKKTQTVTLLEEFKANFSVTVLDDGVTIQCTDKTVNATKWLWNFGDKTTSTQQNPKHTYSVEKENTPLLFTISLTATSSSGKTSSAAAMVTIIKQSGPTADFYYQPLAPKANEAVSFNNSSKLATSFSWKFGDGSTSTDRSPKHTYTKAGTYTVSLTASNGKLSDTKTQTITISDKPTVSKVTITAYSVLYINWKDGNNEDWDYSNGPDIYFKEIYKGTTKLSIAEDKSKCKDNVTEAMLPYTHTVSWELTDLSATYTFKMYDYDSPDPDDLMASFTWNVSEEVSQQPSNITLLNNGSAVKFDLKWE